MCCKYCAKNKGQIKRNKEQRTLSAEKARLYVYIYTYQEQTPYPKLMQVPATEQVPARLKNARTILQLKDLSFKVLKYHANDR
jgi:thioredoxin-related protein